MSTKRTPIPRILLLAASVAGACLLTACHTSKPVPVSTAGDAYNTDALTPGKVLYLQNCSACHGMEGRGDGPAAVSFCIPPPDLTRIAEKNKGEFPFGEIMAIIEGKREIDAHGYREMPVWGDVFQNTAKRAGLEESQTLADGNLLAITSWLERLQTYPVDEN